MHTTNLRRVGGSIMLAVPPALLDLLKLGIGAKVEIDVQDGRLVVQPRTRPRYSIDELLAQCEKSGDAPSAEDRAWMDAKPVGNELL
jgi:antitoxin ChpS